MARIKFTSPPRTITTAAAAAAQTPTRGMMTLTTLKSVQKPKQTQNEITKHMVSGKQTQLLQQQQSQEMVQIMLHVSVSVPTTLSSPNVY